MRENLNLEGSASFALTTYVIIFSDGKRSY